MSIKIERKFGLQHKSGCLIGFNCTSNSPGSDSREQTFTLEKNTNSDPLWLVGNAVHAEYVRKNSTEWYNADHESPRNPFPAEDLKVVSFKMTTEIKETTPSIPTFEEWADVIYKHEPQHLDRMKKEYKKDQGTKSENQWKYSIYDLYEYYHKLGFKHDGITPLEPASKA